MIRLMLIQSLELSLDEVEAIIAERLQYAEVSGSVEFVEDSTYTAFWDDSEPESGTWILEDHILTITS